MDDEIARLKALGEMTTVRLDSDHFLKHGIERSLQICEENMTLDMERLAAVFAESPRVVFAVLFGSSMEGTVRHGSDVDIGVLLMPAPGPIEFFDFYVRTTARLPDVAELDLIDLSRAGSVLAFEALSGRRLFVRDAEALAAFASRVAREYESDMLHATAHRAA